MAIAADHRVAALASLIGELSSCHDLDEVLTRALDELDDLFGFDHSMLLVLDPEQATLVTIASRGYEQAGIGSEVRVGHGVIGKAAAEGRPVRVNNLQRMLVYMKSALPTADREGADATEIPLPGLPVANSQLAAPAFAIGQLVGVLLVESTALGAFTNADEDVLAVIAHLVGAALEADRDADRDDAALPPPATEPVRPRAPRDDAVNVRFFAADGSVFVDGDYLINGVAGRVRWRLARDDVNDGRTDFTNRELRLDPNLDLPAFRDNLESRLVLLKRRLEERGAPLGIHKTGRGRFRVQVDGVLRLDVPK